MNRVNIRPIGRSIRGVAPGGTVGVSRRDARILVRLGRAEFADGAPAPLQAGPDYEDMSYNDLRALAAEQEIEVEGRKKDDYIAALRKGYNRRDMRARE